MSNILCEKKEDMTECPFSPSDSKKPLLCKWLKKWSEHFNKNMKKALHFFLLLSKLPLLFVVPRDFNIAFLVRGKLREAEKRREGEEEVSSVPKLESSERGKCLRENKRREEKGLFLLPFFPQQNCSKYCEKKKERKRRPFFLNSLGTQKAANGFFLSLSRKKKSHLEAGISFNFTGGIKLLEWRKEGLRIFLLSLEDYSGPQKWRKAGECANFSEMKRSGEGMGKPSGLGYCVKKYVRGRIILAPKQKSVSPLLRA